jgi:uncharacterized repeat protein (TIGR02543 family)
LKNGANVEITLVGDNILESHGYGSPCQSTALAVPGGTTVTITSTTNGALTATGGYLGAGIGGLNGASFGAININGNAKITATGGSWGAGIGGGYGNAVGGTITIGGDAKVTATGNSGAGIGGGAFAYPGAGGGGGGTIIIGGNAQVTATGEGGGAGIGAGNYSDGITDITIGGNATVIASSDASGAGIGGSHVVSTYGGTQIISVAIGSNAQVTATGGSLGGAGIGTGYNEAADGSILHDLTVNITGNATVNATANGTVGSYNNNSPGIGLAGENGSVGTATVNIAGTATVTATASTVVGKGAAPDIGASDPGVTNLTLPVFIVGGGTGATGAASYLLGLTVSIDAGYKYGYTFKEWTTADGVVFADATSAQTTFPMLARAVTVTATWTYTGGGDKQNYTVKFNSNGGSAVYYRTVVAYDILKKPADPTRAGYAFAGWFTDEALTSAYDFGAKVTKSFTLYAKWTGAAGEVGTGFPFDDVNGGDWFYGDVVWAWENGLMTGTSATKFSPFMNTTRGMITTVIYRLGGEPSVTGKSPFTDVDSKQYYAPAIAWASANGVVKGYSSTLFAPDKDITREELVTLLWRYTALKGLDVSAAADISGFGDDEKVSGYALDAMKWAVSVGIIKGDNFGKLNPQSPATRAEVAAILHRFIEAAE